MKSKVSKIFTKHIPLLKTRSLVCLNVHLFSIFQECQAWENF